MMKKISILLICTLFIACNSNPKKETAKIPGPKSESVKPEETGKPMASADYTSLFMDYQCDMEVEEVSEILQIPVSDLAFDTQSQSKKCLVDYSRNGTYEARLWWGAVPSSKKGNQKMIDESLEFKKQNISPAGMSIDLAETGDCYLRHHPMHGSILILNSNYDMAFEINYGTRMQGNGESRTKEQQKTWQQKMTDLANYLLKKHRK